MNENPSFQAFGDQLLFNSELLAAALRYRLKLIKNNLKMPKTISHIWLILSMRKS
jgi:hypothetical protein